MPGWQVPGIPGVPTPADLARMMQVQSELMTTLPETLAELTRAVRSLADTVNSANRVVERLDRLLDELEDPVHGLKPGIEKVSEVLDSPVVGRLPAMLESVESTVLPIAARAEWIRNRFRRRRSTSADN